MQVVETENVGFLRSPRRRALRADASKELRIFYLKYVCSEVAVVVESSPILSNLVLSFRLGRRRQ